MSAVTRHMSDMVRACCYQQSHWLRTDIRPPSQPGPPSRFDSTIPLGAGQSFASNNSRKRMDRYMAHALAADVLLNLTDLLLRLLLQICRSVLTRWQLRTLGTGSERRNASVRIWGTQARATLQTLDLGLCLPVAWHMRRNTVWLSLFHKTSYRY